MWRMNDGFRNRHKIPGDDMGGGEGQLSRKMISSKRRFPNLLILCRSPTQRTAAAARVTGFGGGMGSLSTAKALGVDYHAKTDESVKS